MASQTIHSKISTGTTPLANPAARTTTGSSTSVDTFGYYSKEMVVIPGTLTDGTFALTLEESDSSGSGFSTVAAGDMIGTFANLATATIQRVAYIGSKRYIRVTWTVTGSPSTGAVFGVLPILGNPAHKPATIP